MRQQRNRRWWGRILAGVVVYFLVGYFVAHAPAEDEPPRPKAGAPVVGGPRLDHKAHMDRGMKCTDCHAPDRGLDDPLQPGPASLETCQKCHEHIDRNLPEAERVRNVFFDEEGKALRQRAVLRYEGDVIWGHAAHDGIDCLSCHADIMTTQVRRAQVLMDMDSCMACHHQRQAENECATCHTQIRSGTPPRTHDRSWSSTHGQTVKRIQEGSERDTCTYCHTQEACAKCHANTRPPSHGPDWMGQHGPLLRTAQQRNQATNCDFCHTQDQCTTCHTEQRPASHDAAWLTGHGPLLHQQNAAGERSNCMYCHKQEQCDTCHTTVKPPSHDSTWMAGHAARLRAGGQAELERCSLCHQSGAWCDQCHQTQAPASHAVNWRIGHADAIARGGRVALDRCAFCHQNEQYCDQCHANTRPPSHDRMWKLRHGEAFLHGGRAGAQRCAFCHQDPAFCDDCHREEQPTDHTNLFRTKTHGLVASIDRSRCQACHQTDFCVRCHEDTPPRSHRTPGWSGARSRHCVGCHFPISNEPSCRTCHLSNPSHSTAPGQPASHGPGLNCRLCHNSVGGGGAKPLRHPDTGVSCELCHRR